MLQITQPSQYRYTQLQHKFAVISEAPSTIINKQTKTYWQQDRITITIINRIDRQRDIVQSYRQDR